MIPGRDWPSITCLPLTANRFDHKHWPTTTRVHGHWFTICTTRIQSYYVNTWMVHASSITNGSRQLSVMTSRQSPASSRFNSITLSHTKSPVLLLPGTTGKIPALNWEVAIRESGVTGVNTEPMLPLVNCDIQRAKPSRIVPWRFFFWPAHGLLLVNIKRIGR